MSAASDHCGESGRLPLGVGSAWLTRIDGIPQIVTDGGEVVPLCQMVRLEHVLAAPPHIRSRGAVAVVAAGLGRRRWRTLDSPDTAQAISRAASSVVLVTDLAHARAVACLASRLLDFGVQCWVSTDAEDPTARARERGRLRWSATRMPKRCARWSDALLGLPVALADVSRRIELAGSRAACLADRPTRRVVASQATVGKRPEPGVRGARRAPRTGVACPTIGRHGARRANST